MNQKEPQKFPIHLPKTSFPMKGNLPQKEPSMVEFWEKNKIYDKIQKKTADSPSLIFVDGPPYANGRIHLGTTLNKILKDILVKSTFMSSKNCPFIPIWDCHGLPIELRTLKKIKTRKPCEVRKACREQALHWVDVQMKQFQRMGVLADWPNKILTMDYQFESEEVRILADLIEKKLLYRGKRPIHWCIKLQTATAASEVEYKDRQSPSIDVKFEVIESKNILLPEKTFFVIWTTTPWTLPANKAICVHPDFDYGLFEISNSSGKKENFILALELKESFEKRTKQTLTLKKKFKGLELENILCSHPFIENQESPVILGNHVTLDAGTGCVHTAPGHGVEDFIVGKKYQLDVYCPVDKAGRFTSDVKFFSGLEIFKANPLIVEKLQASSHLVHHEDIHHSYPYNPRSKSPLIFRVTDQWFLNFDDSSFSIRKKALDLIENTIQFIPSNTKQRFLSMIKESPDWCLSRQRIWGVPIVVFYCEDCNHPLKSPELIRQIAKKMEETKRGIEYYFTSSEKNLIPENTTCEKCQGNSFKKGEDILDVWFDSGVCHAILKKLKGDHFFPADVYFEGSDQHRGWFQTSLNSSIALTGKTPFKTLITHGFVYDLEKRKMSKSEGNIIDPDDIIKKHGAEILRLWVSCSDYSQDISSGEETLTRLSESYRRFRNIFRYLLGNLNDFDPNKDLLPSSKLLELDRWILSLLSHLSDEIIQSYQQFEFHKVYQSLNKFFTTHLSSLYLDIIKDRLYTFKQDSLERRSAQTALYILLNSLTKLMAPITSFLSEEVHQYIPGNKKESIFLNEFEKINFHSKSLEKSMDILLDLRKAVIKEIESLRKDKIIGSSLEAHVELTLPQSTYKVFKDYEYKKEFFIVSCIQLTEGSSLNIKVTKVKGEKCIRCWHFDPNLNDDKLCLKCLKNL